MIIRTYSDEYKSQTQNLILSILEEEFGFMGIVRPDLENISETYQKNKSNFWIALENRKVIGTIALSNLGNKRGYLRRLCVDKKFRRLGIANELFLTLFSFVKENEYKEIFLSTMEVFVAANKFYNKLGFKRIDSLPKDLPTFGDTIFYKLEIVKNFDL